MAERIQFTGELKDFVSKGLAKIATNSQRSIATVNRGLLSISRSTVRPARSIDMINTQLDKLKRTRDLSVDTRQVRRANREIGRLEKRLDNLYNKGRRQQQSGGGLGLGGMVAGGGAAFGLGRVVDAGFQAQAQRTSFEVLSGKQAGGQLFEQLTKFEQESIYGTEVKKNAQTLLAFGAANESVIPSVKMLGDIAMGNKQRFESLTLAYAQSQSTGKLMGQDLLQMVNAGFNPLKTISDKTGKSMAVLKDEMSKGLITFDMVEQAFVDATSEGGKFFNMTERMGQTDFGKWQAFKGQISGLAMQFGLRLAPAIGNVISNGLVPAAKWIGENENLVLGLGSALLTGVTAYKAVTIAQGLLNSTMWKNPVGLIIGGIAALTAGFIYAYNKVSWFRGGIDAAWTSIKGFAGLIKDVVIDRIYTLISGITGLGKMVSQFFSGEWSKAWETGKKAASDLLGVSTAKKAIAGFKEVGKDAATAYVKGVKEIEQKEGSKKESNGLLGAFMGDGTAANNKNPFAGSASTASYDTGSATTGGGVGAPRGIGGGRSVSITIGKLIENITIKSDTMDMGVQELERKLEEAVVRVMASVAKTVS